MVGIRVLLVIHSSTANWMGCLQLTMCTSWDGVVVGLGRLLSLSWVVAGIVVGVAAAVVACPSVVVSVLKSVDGVHLLGPSNSQMWCDMLEQMYTKS